jgi:hypothetical protein
MGCGDWNDGMNLVGRDGKGSVWLAWFAHANLQQFASLAQTGRGSLADAAPDRRNSYVTILKPMLGTAIEPRQTISMTVPWVHPAT